MKTGRIHALLLWVAAPALLWLSVTRPHDVSAGRATRLPGVAGRFSLAEEFEITPSMRGLLGTDDATWRRYDADDEPPVFVVGVFHSTNWKSLHPPHTCLLGSNMDIVVDDLGRATTPSGREFDYGRLLLRSMDRRGARYLSLFVYVAPPDLVTGVYARFVLHHAPRAILRQDVAGCLLRVETWVGEGGVEAAEARCREVLVALVPAAEELLR